MLLRIFKNRFLKYSHLNEKNMVLKTSKSRYQKKATSKSVAKTNREAKKR